MSDLKISQLSAATTSQDTDQLVIVRGSTNLRTTKQLLLQAVVSSVATAQSAANSAASAAATADSKAVAAQSDAAQALANATQALSDAAAADAKAVTADGKAVAAQADATQALSDAATADAKAVVADGKAVAAQSDATQALADAAAADANADARVPKATVTAGLPSPFTLDVPRNVGSFASPVNGNITIDPAAATYDGVAVVYHQDASEPTITVTGGNARKFGTANYDTAKVNVIMIFWNGGTNVAYSYIPEQ